MGSESKSRIRVGFGSGSGPVRVRFGYQKILVFPRVSGFWLQKEQKSGWCGYHFLGLGRVQKRRFFLPSFGFLGTQTHHYFRCGHIWKMWKSILPQSQSWSRFLLWRFERQSLVLFSLWKFQLCGLHYGKILANAHQTYHTNCDGWSILSPRGAQCSKIWENNCSFP